jgi:organic hydroperoxide reductase OsmC/OhrA
VVPNFASQAGIIVSGYTDTPTGTMPEDRDGGGHFTDVTPRPVVTIADPAMADKAAALHHDANTMCFIAHSVNFPVSHEPAIETADRGSSRH